MEGAAGVGGDAGCFMQVQSARRKRAPPLASQTAHLVKGTPELTGRSHKLSPLLSGLGGVLTGKLELSSLIRLQICMEYTKKIHSALCIT